MYKPAVNSHAYHLDSHVLFIHIFYSQHSEVMCFDMAVVLFHRFVFWFGFRLFFFLILRTYYLLGPLCVKICVCRIFCSKNLFSFFSSFVSSIFCVFFFTNLLLDGCWTSWIFLSLLSCFSSVFLFTRLDYVIFIFHSCLLQNFKVSSFNVREFFLVLW